MPELSYLCDAARAAGEIALRYFQANPKSWTKAGDSPVTEADLAIDRMLHTELRSAFPSFGWVSEEIEDDGSRLTADASFIVDPIDGTRGFIQGGNDWAISIATTLEGEPFQGVLFNPVTGELFYAERGTPAAVEVADGSTFVLQPTQAGQDEDALIAHSGPPQFLAGMRKAPRVASLALRLAKVAQGSFDGCLVRPNAKDWDIAAADAIVRASGVALTSLDGHMPTYDRPSVSHGALVCGTASIRAQLIEKVQARDRQSG